MAKIGYARVSSKSQDYQGQMAALKAAGCEKIYSEKVSGKDTKDRREFNKLMKALLPGDTVYVAKLDRLARSSRDLANILHDLDEGRLWLRQPRRELVRHLDPGWPVAGHGPERRQ